MRLLFAFLCLFSSSLFAKIEFPLVYLTWTEDPMTTMTIQWITLAKDQDDTVQFRAKDRQKNSHRNWIPVNGDHRALPQNSPYIVHRVTLRNLQADSLYRFQLGKMSKSYLFRTMPQDLTKPVRFIVGGDVCNSNTKRYRQMSHRAAKSNPRFAVLGGDLAYSAPKGSTGDPEDFDRWCKFFDGWLKEMKDKDGCLIPLFVTIGNHEVTGHFSKTLADAPFYYAFFEKACYDFGFGNYAHFIFLDSGHTHGIKGKQKKWLAETLKSHKNYLHRFATYHVGAYPSVGNYDDHVRDHVRKHWVPLFEKYKLDVCFENHDHAYKRTHPLIDSKVNPDGIVYFGDGSWGVKPRKPKGERPYIACAVETQQVLVVELYKDWRKFWAIDLDGKKIDQFEQPTKAK